VLVSRGDMEALFTPEMIYERWPALDEYIEPDQLLAKSNNDARVMELAEDAGFQRDRATLYIALLHRAPALLSFRAWCAEGLRNISSDEWLTELQNAAALMMLGLVCQQQGELVELKEPFRSAVQIF